jgi:hypothetical protein
MMSPIDENESAFDLLPLHAQLRPSKAQSLAAQLPGQVANGHEAEAGILSAAAAAIPEPHAENAGVVLRRLHHRESASVRLGPVSPSCSVPDVESQVNSGSTILPSPLSDEPHRAPSTTSSHRAFLVPKSPKTLSRKRTFSGTRRSRKSPEVSVDCPPSLRQRSPKSAAPEEAAYIHNGATVAEAPTIELPPPILPMMASAYTALPPPPRPRRLAPVRANPSPHTHNNNHVASNRSPDGRIDEGRMFLGRQPRTPCTPLPVFIHSSGGGQTLRTLILHAPRL